MILTDLLYTYSPANVSNTKLVNRPKMSAFVDMVGTRVRENFTFHTTKQHMLPVTPKVSLKLENAFLQKWCLETSDKQ